MRLTTAALLAASLLLAAPLAARAQKGDWTKLLEKRTFTSGKDKLLYRLMKPAGYDAKKSYPLVVFLHGAGERGDDNEAQLKHGVAEFAKAEARKAYPCFLIAPQCPKGQSWAPRDRKAEGASASGRLVLELIPALQKEFSLDDKRLYLTGLSMGGYGTWDLLARKPDLFAAGVPVCGGGDPKAAEKIAKLPIWAFHGALDRAVRPERSREMIAALQKAGGAPGYTEYPGVGHDSWVQAYADPVMRKWLFDQKRK